MANSSCVKIVVPAIPKPDTITGCRNPVPRMALLTTVSAGPDRMKSAKPAFALAASTKGMIDARSVGVVFHNPRGDETGHSRTLHDDLAQASPTSSLTW